MSSFVGQNLTFSNLWWNIVMDAWNLDDKALGKWQVIATLQVYNPYKIYKEWQKWLDQHLVLVTLYCGLQSILNKTFRIGDTKYDI